ncbi:MAG: ferrous iron transport protein B [Bacteroidota bacterium]
MFLSELKNGQTGIITKVRGRGAFRKRIIEMGFVKGKKVTVIKNAPLKDPIEYSIMGYFVSLRRSEAAKIEILTAGIDGSPAEKTSSVQLPEKYLEIKAREIGKTINIALVGNPNSGKTTFFNFASKSKEKVGNYSGVTVSSKTASFVHKGYTFNITDLPGTYSLSAYSPEELFVRKYIMRQTPDLVVNVVDASNLERNLYLTTQLIDMDIRVIVALNMYDELQNQGDQLDIDSLGELLGIPFVPTVSYKGKGINELFDTIINVFAGKDKTIRHIHMNYGEEIEESIARVQRLIKREENYNLTDTYSSRYLSVKLLEKDREVKRIVNSAENKDLVFKKTEEEIHRLETLFSEDSETLVTDAKYAFIAGALKETLHKGVEGRRKNTETIDTLLTHSVFGFPVFIFFMWLMFQATFRLGQYPMHWIESGVAALNRVVFVLFAEGTFKDLLMNGIIDGVGGVAVFLPNILILFFFISLMEDTGYMSRVAFIMDRLMHKIGLHGKSFIPLLMGFGCNVPAIMATRTIENRNDRLLTMLINPFMSCSARLPVYVLFIGAFFPDKPGTMLFVLYGLGILIAILMALLLKKTIFKGKGLPFVMELPPYRVPTFRSTVKHMWNRAGQYIKKMGGVILIASIVIWALGNFPVNSDVVEKHDQMKQKLELYHADILSRYTLSKKEDSTIRAIKSAALRELDHIQQAAQQEYSFVGRIGKSIEPIIYPLGYDWKMGVSLISGIAAKEIVISTLGVLYHADGHEDSLQEVLKEQEYDHGERAGKKVFDPLTAFSFLVFILIYFPCIAVLVTIKNESGSWKWALFTGFYTTFLAYLTALVVYQVGKIII